MSPQESLLQRIDLHLGPKNPHGSVVQAGGTRQLQPEGFLGASKLLGNKGRISDKWKWGSKTRSFARSPSPFKTIPCFWHPTSTCALGSRFCPPASLAPPSGATWPGNYSDNKYSCVRYSIRMHARPHLLSRTTLWHYNLTFTGKKLWRNLPEEAELVSGWEGIYTASAWFQSSTDQGKYKAGHIHNFKLSCSHI